ncbi:tellurium resistance protein TehB [Halarcobacter ebronensis]|uniref:Tellurium resistance protein TehB n=1 Tax=Halarcobacter ebronensis TaxID=1462615 RepID=A0A4Q0YG90_9BACT|nr:methyltransferase domain-containing protein [Halarcobacter ebronensis]RXJ69215.1 tellurium resistance protein TehB [Halarcobacter ebronensis]
MALEDRLKWDKKYETTPALLEKREASAKLKEIIDLVKGNKALDVACGTGRNSIFLASKGFVVDAIDISEVALENLNRKDYRNITTKQVDLDEFTPAKESYDLIVQTNFLDRKLIPILAKALKKEGILLIETYMEDEINEKPPSNSEFLLKKEELKSFFDDNFEVLDYDEFLNESHEIYKMMKQLIVVKRK